MEKISIEEINRLLHVDGKNIKAMDVLDSVSKETLVATLTYIVAKLSDIYAKPELTN